MPPTISISDASTIEGNIGTVGAVFTVTLSTASTQVVSVEYATIDGSATNPEDYTAVPTATLIFPTGVQTRLITITVLGDTLFENDETFLVNLANPTNATIGDNQGQGAIIDDEPIPAVQFSNPTYSVDEDGGTAVIGTILSPTSSLTVTVAYSSTDITATAGEDYEETSGTLTFSPGQASLTFTVSITDDTPPNALDEPDEAVRLTLGNPTNAVLGATNPATLTLVDNDTDNPDCAGIYPPGEPNIGPPNGVQMRPACGVEFILDLGTTITVDGNSDYDLVYYEIPGNPPLTFPEIIYLDAVEIQIGSTPSGPWYTIFAWGDAIDDTNTTLTENPPPIPSYSDLGASSDNQVVESPPLVGPSPYQTGIQIDVDNPPPPTGKPPLGDYRYMRIISPPGSVGDGDAPDVDAIEPL